MRTRILALCLAVGLALLAPPARAQGEAPAAGTVDPKLKAALESLDLKYEVGPEGDVKLTFALEGDRSQLVFVQSKMEKYGDMMIREIWAPAFKTKEPLAQEVANQLMADSHGRIIGSWELMNLGDEKLVVYTIKVPDPADPKELYGLIHAAMLSADEMEKAITGKDDF